MTKAELLVQLTVPILPNLLNCAGKSPLAEKSFSKAIASEITTFWQGLEPELSRLIPDRPEPE